MDYIHYNPVKHGYVAKPWDWLYRRSINVSLIWIGVCRSLLGTSLIEVGTMRFGLLHPT
ncbi:MAG: hypothetical protein H7Z73_00650 [Candidatus Saccharibacteria bacterium]|nr:hypothetical protein [Moraxellaceae bacterium]